ncbi:MAG: uroporphyrinogen decarboxylase family protein [Planctomycetota bacterium]
MSSGSPGACAAAETDRAVLVCLPGTALGDIALVPAPFLRRPRGIRDISEWYMSIAARPEYVQAIFEKQVEIALANLARINDAVGDLIDVVVLCGTDFGTQQSTFCSEDTFRRLWLPHYRRMTEWIHAHTGWAVLKHSCGAVASLLEAFIDAGFDILNPVQCSAHGMEPEGLKQRFGDRLAFWGGGVDTQQTLPFGTPEEVRAQVLERCRIFAEGGGFVFNTIHNVQAQTPLENMVALIDAVHDFNGASV